MRYLISVSALLAVSASMIACGGGGGGNGNEKQDITVSLSPKTISVAGEETHSFTATILNPNNRGVNWSLSGSGCTGSACGSIGSQGGNSNQGWTVSYTAPLTVPNPATVTLKATSIDDTTKSDAATITITAPVVSVGVTPTAPTVLVGATQQFTAAVRGSANKDVKWSISGPGSISTAGLYTAPSTLHPPASVTVTATLQADNTKSGSATITIPAVSLTLSPEIKRVVLGGTQQFSASVTNAVNTGVAWTVWGPGTVDNSGFYTAPLILDDATTAAVTATSRADPDLSRTVSFTVVVTPTISPLQVTVPAGATQQFTSDIPVSWEVGGVAGTDPLTWGSISADGLYTAPLSPPWTGKVNIRATVKSDPRHSANAVATIVFSNASLQGHYAMRYRGLDQGALFGVASFEADGSGTIPGGWMSFYQSTAPPASVPVTGTYTVKPDGRGSATLHLQQGGQSLQFPIQFALTSNSSGRVIGFDDTGTGWGNLDLQTGLSAPVDLSGTYVLSLDGFNNSGSIQPVAMAGMFTASGGTISSGIADINSDGSVAHSVPFTGTYTPIHSYEPSTATLNVDGEEAHFIFYQLNPNALIFISGDADTGYLGMAVRRDPHASFSTNSLSGNVVLLSTGYTRSDDHSDAVALGRLTADGLGNLKNGIVDNIASHPTWASSIGYAMASWGTYSIDSTGRGTMTISTDGGGYNVMAVYMTAPNNLVFVSLMNQVISTGQLVPQSSESFGPSTIRGSWALNLRETLYYWPGRNDVIAQVTSDAAGSLTGTADVNAMVEDKPNRALLTDSFLTGSYTMDSNGRGEATLNFNGITARYAMYAASGRTIFMVPINATSWAALGVAARQF
jgi:hypothetical protein